MFGSERAAIRVYLDEIVADRFILTNGMQMLNDELQVSKKTYNISSLIVKT